MNSDVVRPEYFDSLLDQIDRAADRLMVRSKSLKAPRGWSKVKRTIVQREFITAVGSFRSWIQNNLSNPHMATILTCERIGRLQAVLESVPVDCEIPELEWAREIVSDRDQMSARKIDASRDEYAERRTYRLTHYHQTPSTFDDFDSSQPSPTRSMRSESSMSPPMPRMMSAEVLSSSLNRVTKIERGLSSSPPMRSTKIVPSPRVRFADDLTPPRHFDLGAPMRSISARSGPSACTPTYSTTKRGAFVAQRFSENGQEYIVVGGHRIYGGGHDRKQHYVDATTIAPHLEVLAG
eukprot:GEMP01033344.1.p1 GENE.GEMP01033344.1~~GEMP01033344.1.p1  ORF type:complete len:294 (+),score=58.18 GEMP01033344.1:205-1086(+)